VKGFQRNPLLPFDPLANLVAKRKRAPSSFVEDAIVSTGPGDMVLIQHVVQRAALLAAQTKTLIPSTLQLGLDIAIAHRRRPLRLHALLMTSDAEFHAELIGLARSIDRSTGFLREGYVSRYWVDQGPQS